ncbi:unnamed protein product, partial [Pleuronectes platessa]
APAGGGLQEEACSQTLWCTSGWTEVHPVVMWSEEMPHLSHGSSISPGRALGGCVLEHRGTRSESERHRGGDAAPVHDHLRRSTIKTQTQREEHKETVNMELQSHV